MRKAVSMIVLVLLLSGVLTRLSTIQPANSEPSTIVVPDDYDTIQKAINHANNGDTIFVKARTYYENVAVNKTVSLLGEARKTTIIDGSEKGTVVTITQDDVTITNFTIRNSGGVGLEAGVLLDHVNHSNITKNNIASNNGDGVKLQGSSSNTVSGNNITNNKDYGVWIQGSSENTVSGNNITNNNLYGILLEGFLNNTISRNNITNNYVGVVLNFSPNNTVSGNNITNNEHRGLDLWDSSGNIFSGNDITDNGWHGVRLYSSSSNTFSGNNITNNKDYGVEFSFSPGNTVSGNNIANHDLYGIKLDMSSDNTLRNNDLNNNKYNLGVFAEYFQDIDSSNTADGKPIYYWVNFRNMTVPVDAGYVALVNCTDITVKNLTLTNNTQGVLLASSANSTIAQNNITSNYGGVWLHGSSGNIVSANNITNNDYYGVSFYHSSGNTVLGNNISNNNNHGMELNWSSNNTISGNIVTANKGAGVMLVSSSNNTLYENNITNNGQGIGLYDSDYNSIYHNNFVDNAEQVDSCPSTNVWDDSYPSGGNYWSGYEERYPNATELDGSGIWDMPYVINENNQDNYPLMRLYGEGLEDTTPPSLSIISPENKTYFASNVSLTFTVSEPTSAWIGFSLDGQANETIVGTTILSDLSDGSHSLIVYANDTFGNVGASDMIYFTIKTPPPPPEPFPTWIIVAAIVTIGGAVTASLIYFTKMKR